MLDDTYPKQAIKSSK